MRFVALVLTVAVLAAIASRSAGADGDPASDYLLGQNVFLPFDAKIPPSKAKQLTRLVANAGHAGFRIRVAVIATRYDLGSVTALYMKPQKYAQFLGTEIYFVYRGRLLVVMSNGYGYSKSGKPLAPGPLTRLPPPGAQATALVSAAETAVQRLAAASGVRLALPQPAGNDQTARDRIIIIAVALTGVALIGAWVLLRRVRRTRAT
jgi:hypothetical protein